MNQPKTLLEAVQFFSNEARCEELLMKTRWPNGQVRCPRCKSTNVRYWKSQKRWRCYHKRHKVPLFSARTGTIFEHSQISLGKWYLAMWLLVNAKNGTSSHEIHRYLGMNQGAAWHIEMRIRDSLTPNRRKLEGVTQCDETFIGPKFANMHADKRYQARKKPNKGKVIVFGALEKNGSVRTAIIPNRSGPTLQREVRKAVAVGSTLYTDELKAYNRLGQSYNHFQVNHAKGNYVDGDATTNDIESFWSLVKRTLRSTYIAVHPDHLRLFLNEIEFRWNTKDLSDGMRFLVALKKAVSRKRLTYDKLTDRKNRHRPRRGG